MGIKTTVLLLWFSFILGTNFIFLCFKLIIIHNYHTPKQRKIKFNARIKVNQTIVVIHKFCELDLSITRTVVKAKWKVII